MSNYEKSGPGGVGKRYGALGLGGVGGITRGNSGEYFLDFEFSASEVEAVNGQVFQIPSSYGLIKEVVIEVEEAFDAGTIKLVYDGSEEILDAPIDLSTPGMITAAVAGGSFELEGGKPITVSVAGISGTAGYCKTLGLIARI